MKLECNSCHVIIDDEEHPEDSHLNLKCFICFDGLMLEYEDEEL